MFFWVLKKSILQTSPNKNCCYVTKESSIKDAQTFSGIQAWSSSRSLRQISRWSSPAPAMMCSPDSSMIHCTMGSDLARRLSPSTSLGRSAGFLASTATRTTGLTLNFITRMLWACSKVVMVPVFTKNWSTPTRPTILPHGTSSMGST